MQQLSLCDHLIFRISTGRTARNYPKGRLKLRTPKEVQPGKRYPIYIEYNIWKDDPTVSVSIVSERKISYKGEEIFISALSAQLKGYKSKHIAPGAHWLFNDKLLSDIYDETYPFEE